ncbi:MAG: ATP-binding protein [Gemmatimonadota bacterium]|jgi:signal transduction histidine kinase
MSDQGWIRTFVRRPDDTSEVASSRALALVVALSCGACGIIWSVLYAAIFGPGPVMALPLLFVVVVGGALAVSAIKRDHHPLIYAQIACITWIPALIQWTIGSTAASGLVIAWSFLGPIGALVFLSFRQALAWMGVFVFIVLVSTLFQPALLGAPLPVGPGYQSAFFAMNVGAAAIVVFIAAAWFVKTIQRELSLRLAANQALAESHRQLMASQQVLVQSEKMAALGRVSAGMAHELNNPVAAVQRGASQLREALAELGRASYSLGLTHLQAGQIERINELEDEAENRIRSPVDLDALERMDREATIQDWLDANGLAAVGVHAAALADLGIDTDALGELHDLFGREALGSVLERLVWWQTALFLITEIAHGSGRITGIVRALKSYTYLGQGAVQAVDLNEGLNDTLVMLNSILQRGIAVTPDLDASLPPVSVHGAELNQVWTNLITNAVDAMGGQGELTVRSRRQGGEAVIQVIDSGPGIPPEVRDRLFDPFVTTKPVGHGTGLGLSISRNIVVQQHGGTIDVQSEPGRTCFEVRLPLGEGSGRVERAHPGADASS